MIQEVMAGRKRKGASLKRDAPTLQASPQALLRVLDDNKPVSDALKLQFKAVFDRYEELVKICSNQATRTRWKVKMNTVFDPAPDYLTDANVGHVRTFSPLEFIVTAILIFVHLEHRTAKELLADVKEMRRYLRFHHKDLRVNAQCWGTSWTYITEEMDVRRGLKKSHTAADEALGYGQRAPSGPNGDSQFPSNEESLSSDRMSRDSSPLSSIPSSESSSESDGPSFPALATRPRRKKKAKVVNISSRASKTSLIKRRRPLGSKKPGRSKRVKKS